MEDVHMSGESGASRRHAVKRTEIGPCWGLVLGPGGTRVCAHLGVAHALAELGAGQPRFVAASGMAALPAALICAGRPLHATARLLANLPWERWIPHGRPPWGIDALLDALALLVRCERVEELPIPLILTTYDVIAGRVHEISSGPLRSSLHAALAVPGLICAAQDGGRTLQSAAPFRPFIDRTDCETTATPVYVDLSGGRIPVETALQALWRSFELPPGRPPDGAVSLRVDTDVLPWDFGRALDAFDAGVEAVSTNRSKLRSMI